MILAGDIGGTKTLLALFDGGRCRFRRRYASGAFARFDEVLQAFLAEAAAVPGLAPPSTACLGIAGPVLGRRVKVTYLPWEIDADALCARFGLRHAELLNDFAAAAHGLDDLAPGELVTLQAGAPLAERPRVLIGAGTGLGVAYLHEGRILSGEGGHASFAPADAQQEALARWLRQRLGRVEAEQVVSGAGLVRIYEFLLEQRGEPATAPARDLLRAEDAAQAVAQAALAGGAPLAHAAVDLFVACYGATAGDHALTVLARGGVFVAGGIAPKLMPRLQAGGFVAAFNDKGMSSAILRDCPVHVVANPDLGLLGAAAFARRMLTPV